MNHSAAEVIGLQALAWLVANEELLPVFLGSTGLAAEDISVRANDPDFLASILEFITMDDAWVLEFCERHFHASESPLRARYILSGEALTTPDW